MVLIHIYTLSVESYLISNRYFDKFLCFLFSYNPFSFISIYFDHKINLCSMYFSHKIGLCNENMDDVCDLYVAETKIVTIF